MHHEINEHSLLEYLEEKPQNACHARERICWRSSGSESTRNCKRPDGDSLESTSWHKRCQTQKHALVMPAESKSLLWKTCFCLSWSLHTVLFSGWMTATPVTGETRWHLLKLVAKCLRHHNPYSIFTLVILIIFILSILQVASPGPTILSPTYQYSRRSKQ